MSHRYKIISTAVIILVTLSFFTYRALRVDNQAADNIDIGGIEFLHTDENEDEDLIITSDKKTYQGFSGTTVYFTIDPLLKGSEEVGVQFYFTDPKAKVVQVYQYQKEDHYWLALPLHGGKIQSNKYSQALARQKEIDGETHIQSNTSFNSLGEKEYFMTEVAYPPGVPGQFLIEAFGSSGSYGILDPWYNSGWLYRKKITINPQYVAGGLTNFPMLFSRKDLDLRATTSAGRVASSTGGDILFTAADGATKLDHEIEYYASTTGELVAWVEVPFVSSTSTRDIYIYYGNDTIPLANQQNATGVWDSDYQGVWHLKEGDSTVADFYKDSTSNARHGTLTDADGDSIAATEKIDGAYDFNGDADDIYTSYTGAGAISKFTISAWIKRDSQGGSCCKGIVSNFPSLGGSSYLSIMINSADKIQFLRGFTTTSGEWATTAGPITDGTWYYVTVTYDDASTANDPLIYLDGISQGITESGTPAGLPYDPVDRWGIGTQWRETTPNNNYWDGIIDEVRLSSAVLRTSGWIQTEYNNQNSPNTFYSYSGEEVEIRSSSVAGVKVRGGVNVRGGVKFR